MGVEKLSLQGIPTHRLVLGPESEVQLSDLAGNAMSVPVICATMLAAICAPELKRERTLNGKSLLKEFALAQKYDSAGGAVLAERGDLYQATRSADIKNFLNVFEPIANDLAVDAFRSSILCICESSGTCTKDSKVLECVGCGMGVCGDCLDRRTDSHSLEEVDAGGDNRPDPHQFERRLRCAVPSILRLGKGWEELMKDGSGLESYSFQLQAVDRKRGHWTLTYGAWEDFGSARQVAELGDPRLGAIASALAAEIYGLDILARDVEDADHNTTRFLVLSRQRIEADPSAGPAITTFVFQVRNVPAALYKALGGFATNGVNITKLESYIIDSSFTVAQFYAEFEGHPAEPAVANALEELQFFCTTLKRLGTYPKADYREQR